LLAKESCVANPHKVLKIDKNSKILDITNDEAEELLKIGKEIKI
jgi:hypothetical protein